MPLLSRKQYASGEIKTIDIGNFLSLLKIYCSKRSFNARLLADDRKIFPIIFGQKRDFQFDGSARNDVFVVPFDGEIFLIHSSKRGTAIEVVIRAGGKKKTFGI